ncbi:MAG: beta-N-acetylglucosaminidase, partial [Tannerellaceae bacterium]
MNKRFKSTIALLAITLSCGTVCAQEAEFDLSSQRSESQDVLKVPGQAIDHKGLIINPTPHSLLKEEGQNLSISKGIKLVDKQKAFANDLGFLKQAKNGVPVTVDFGKKIAAKKGVKAISGAYTLTIGKKGIEITGFDDKGAFY